MFRIEIWMITNLIAFGVIAGMGYVMLSTPGSTDVPQRNEAAAALSAATTNDVMNSLEKLASSRISSNEVVELIKQGDRSLLSGNVHAAAVRYNKSLKLDPQPTVPLLIRLAVCAEANDQWLLAEKLYLEAEQSAAHETHRLVSRLGAARVWQHLRKSDDALRSLSDVVLHSHLLEGQPADLRAQSIYQLASLVQEIALRDYHFDPSHQDGVVFRNELPDLTLLIQQLDSGESVENNFAASIDSGELPSGQIVLVQRPNNAVNNSIISAAKEFTPLAELLRELATVAKFDLELTAKARSVISARSKSLQIRNQPLSLILDSLLAPLELCWSQDENRLQIKTLYELDDPEERTRTALEVAQRFYRNFSLSFPGDYRLDAAMLASGNLYFLTGDLDSAGNRYEALVAANPPGELRAALAFNYGKLNRRIGRTELATDQLFLAVDQSYDPLLKSAGYWIIGQIYLEQDELEDSIQASVRALATARDTKRKQLAAVTLARAYLLNNNPLAANQVLFENRKEFEESSSYHLVALLSNYAQYIGVEDQRSKQVAEDRLVQALSGLSKQPLTSFLDLYVAGRAYQELGFPEKAIMYYTAAADSTDVPVWKNRILFGLATEKNKTGQAKDAADIYENLIAANSTPWSKLSQINLAELYLQNNLPEKCLSVCQQLILGQLDSDERQKTLSMMGFAYRKLDQHYSSALCFAGIFPPDTAE